MKTCFLLPQAITHIVVNKSEVSLRFLIYRENLLIHFLLVSTHTHRHLCVHRLACGYCHVEFITLKDHHFSCSVVAATLGIWMYVPVLTCVCVLLQYWTNSFQFSSSPEPYWSTPVYLLLFLTPVICSFSTLQKGLDHSRNKIVLRHQQPVPA